VTSTSSRSKDDAGERASAAVEFALVLPLVFIMALALVQVGLIVKDQLVVEEAARAGAREAAVTTDDGWPGKRRSMRR
jgi:Flp pilus assembly protein TadG